MDNVILQKLESFAKDSDFSTKSTERKSPGEEALNDEYREKLDRTLAQLQELVNEQENALHELRTRSSSKIDLKPSTDDGQRLRQLRLVKHAYLSASTAEPFLPPEDSALPFLLALRQTQTAIKDSVASIDHDQQALQTTKAKLAREETDLRNARALNAALKDRIDHLRAETKAKAKKSEKQLWKEALRAAQKRRDELSSATDDLADALDRFIDTHLASMLAAEELGGPITGSVAAVDLPDEIFVAGFNGQGRANKYSDRARDKNQLRIDDIWNVEDEDEDEETADQHPRRAAAAEAKALLKRLLDACEGGAASPAYILLERESAVARFLVRAKVARLHPNDARKIRLVDFAREVEP